MGTVPSQYVQMFSNYDKSIVDKCHTVKYHSLDKARNDICYAVPCVFATPDRAFAQIRSQIARQKGIPKEQIDTITIPLPIISISRVNQELDLSRFVEHTFNRLYYSPSKDKYLGMVRPTPWDMTFQIDTWTRTISDLDDLTTQIVLWFRSNEFFLSVDHPIPMGTRIVRTELKGMADISQLSPGTEDKRMLRRTFSLVVHGWIVHAPIDAKIIKKVIVDYYDYTDELSPEFLERSITLPLTAQVVATPHIPGDDSMGKIYTTMFGLLIQGEPSVGENYGHFVVPSTATITGMSAAVLGKAPTGANLVLQLTKNGVADATRYVTVLDGAKKASSSFSPIGVMAGDELGVHCTSIGSTESSDWIEIRFDATIDVSI